MVRVHFADLVISEDIRSMRSANYTGNILALSLRSKRQFSILKSTITLFSVLYVRLKMNRLFRAIFRPLMLYLPCIKFAHESLLRQNYKTASDLRYSHQTRSSA